MLHRLIAVSGSVRVEFTPSSARGETFLHIEHRAKGFVTSVFLDATEAEFRVPSACAASDG